MSARRRRPRRRSKSRSPASALLEEIDRAEDVAEGAALIGLRPGQSIRWHDRMGAERLLTVLAAPAEPPA
jgi:hypothetical protein